MVLNDVESLPTSSRPTTGTSRSTRPAELTSSATSVSRTSRRVMRPAVALSSVRTGGSVAPDAVVEPVVAPDVVGGSRLVVACRADAAEHRPGRAAEGAEADEGGGDHRDGPGDEPAEAGETRGRRCDGAHAATTTAPRTAQTAIHTSASRASNAAERHWRAVGGPSTGLRRNLVPARHTIDVQTAVHAGATPPTTGPPVASAGRSASNGGRSLR